MIDELRDRVERVGRALDIEERAKRLAHIEEGMRMRGPDHVDPALLREWTWLRRVQQLWTALKVDLERATAGEAPGILRTLEDRVRRAEIVFLLPQPEDLCNAFLRVRGTDAPWVERLFDMYESWARLSGYTVTVHDDQRDDGPDRPSILAEVKGDFAYGRLADETGVHALLSVQGAGADERFARIGAVVEVWVAAPWSIGQDLPYVEIRMDKTTRPKSRIKTWPERTYLDVTHLPTGINVRAEGMVAMSVLRSRLTGPRARRDADATATPVREYAREPRPRVFDPRTGAETRDLDSVLAGEIEGFLEACYRRRAPGNMRLS